MAVRFTVDEVLATAEAIEANAIHFYDLAAASVSRDDCRRLLKELAGWEQSHKQTFADMRTALSDAEKTSPVFDPDDEAALYLRALSDTSVFKLGEDPGVRLGRDPAYRDILLAAIGLEKESIVFYVGMRDLVSQSMGQSKVDAILNEERTHVAMLGQELSRLE
ncbi:MAG: ferritin family protein [Planctomycetota bacterium]|nr:ferritin family protein [Planctomycetota bacterium]